MEADVTTRQDDESIRIKSDQPMEDKNKHDSEHVTRKPSHVQEIFVHAEQVNNLLLIRIDQQVQLVPSKHVRPILPKPIYIFPETS